MKTPTTKWLRNLSIVSICIGLAACGGSSNNDDDTTPPVTQDFRIDVVNLTAAQPFSPIAVVAHDGNYSLFTVGQAATAGLELMAEGGDNSDVLLEANANSGVLTTVSDTAPTGPGGSTSLTITVEEEAASNLEIVATTMLVNTNDAFTALNNLGAANMAVGESRTATTISYDSGTEANTEAAGTIPGPADGGEGFNAVRDDIANEVRMHSGVLSADDGLNSSRLSEIHRWDNPVARITVTRTR